MNRIAVGSDEKTSLTEEVIFYLRDKGFEVELSGALSDDDPNWPIVAHKVASLVASGRAIQGVLFCWTGTGVSIAANKTPGIRAALCSDAETARGARKWNDANVLCMSLRTTSIPLAKEILDTWLVAEVDPSERRNIERIEPVTPAPRV